MAPAPASKPAALLRARLLELLAPVVAAAGLELDDVTVTAAGRRSLIRVSVDAEGGVDLDGIATVSRAISESLDADTPGGPDFSDPYVLEVSSPGVDRPLTEARHWTRAIGRMVEVDLDGAPVLARIRATDEAGVTLEVAGVKGRPSKTRIAAWASLGRGRVQVEFNRKGSPELPAVEDVEDVDDGLDDADDDSDGDDEFDEDDDSDGDDDEFDDDSDNDTAVEV
jgi:ribosome maturation factor RimP